MRVKDVLAELGIERKSIVVALVNSRVATLDTELADGDKVRLIPPLGGG
jgi:molybdopterin converting factor small subunit